MEKYSIHFIEVVWEGSSDFCGDDDEPSGSITIGNFFIIWIIINCLRNIMFLYMESINLKHRLREEILEFVVS